MDKYTNKQYISANVIPKSADTEIILVLALKTGTTLLYPYTIHMYVKFVPETSQDISECFQISRLLYHHPITQQQNHQELLSSDLASSQVTLNLPLKLGLIFIQRN